MTKQDFIDLDDAEMMDLGVASKETEGGPGNRSEVPELSSFGPPD